MCGVAAGAVGRSLAPGEDELAPGTPAALVRVVLPGMRERQSGGGESPVGTPQARSVRYRRWSAAVKNDRHPDSSRYWAGDRPSPGPALSWCLRRCRWRDTRRRLAARDRALDTGL